MDKHARGEGLNNLIRAESEFLSLYERDQQIEQLKTIQLEEEQMQTRVSEEIITLQKSSVDYRVLLVLVLLFLVAGYLIGTLQKGTELYLFGSASQKLRE